MTPVPGTPVPDAINCTQKGERPRTMWHVIRGICCAQEAPGLQHAVDALLRPLQCSSGTSFPAPVPLDIYIARVNLNDDPDTGPDATA
jgi:hypothetical protein